MDDVRIPIDARSIEEIAQLARQIMAPMVRYGDDPLLMAQSAIAANHDAARRILHLLKSAKAIDDAPVLP